MTVSTVFIALLQFSLTAGIIVLAVLLLRLCFKGAPRWLICAAWGLVALRLVLPFSIESRFSLLPKTFPFTTETVEVTLPTGSDPLIPPEEPAERPSPEPAEPTEPLPPVVPVEPISSPGYTYRVPVVNSGIAAVDNTINPILQEQFRPAAAPADEGSSVDLLQRLLEIASYVWLIGAVLMLGYMVFSHLLLAHHLADSIPYQGDQQIRQSGAVHSPFILGILRPRIYLPMGIGEETAAAVVAHERTHMRRGDHLLKPFGFLLLSVYWFHPLLWVGYAMFCRDIEFACDEKVVRRLSIEGRRSYARALLDCGIGSEVRHRYVTACPLAFGEVSIKERVKKVIYYKKPAFWIVIATAVAMLFTGVLLLTSPTQEKAPEVEIGLEEERGEGYVLPTGAGQYATVSVPEGTVALAAYAFKGATIETLELPASLREVDSTAFEGSTIGKIVAGEKTYEFTGTARDKRQVIPLYLSEHPDIRLVFNDADGYADRTAAITVGWTEQQNQGLECVWASESAHGGCYSYQCDVAWVKQYRSYVYAKVGVTDPQMEALSPMMLGAVSGKQDAWRFLCEWKQLAPGLQYFSYRSGFAYYEVDARYFGIEDATLFSYDIFVPAGTPFSAFEKDLTEIIKQQNGRYLNRYQLRLHLPEIRELTATVFDDLRSYQPQQAPEGKRFIGWEQVKGSYEIVATDRVQPDKLGNADRVIDLYPVFSAHTLTVIFENTQYQKIPKRISIGDCLGWWKQEPSDPFVRFLGWGIESGERLDYGYDDLLREDAATLSQLREDGSLHLWPIYERMSDYEIIAETYRKFRDLYRTVYQLDPPTTAYSGERNGNGYHALTTGLFGSGSATRPLTAALLRKQAEAFLDASFVDAAVTFPEGNAKQLLLDENGVLYLPDPDALVVARHYDLEETGAITESYSGLYRMTVNVRYRDLGVTYPEDLYFQLTANSCKIVGGSLMEVLYRGQGADRVQVFFEGMDLRYAYLGQSIGAVLPVQLQKDGKVFAFWTADAKNPLAGKIVSSGTLTKELYTRYQGEDGVLRLTPMYLTPSEWWGLYAESDRAVLKEGGNEWNEKGCPKAVQLALERYPYCSLCASAWETPPEYMAFTGSGKKLENSCIYEYEPNECIVINEGVTEIHGIGCGAKLLYLPKSLQECTVMFFEREGAMPPDFSDTLICYAGSKADFEKIRFDLSNPLLRQLLAEATVLYQVQY